MPREWCCELDTDGPRWRAVPLDKDNPRVFAAQQAEQRLYDYYGLEPACHLVALPRLGLRVRITAVGSGPPVLVVPGNTGDGFPFAPLLPHRDLVRYTVSTVLDSLGIDRVPIVAHSMGGHWSQPSAMDRRPESMTGCT